MALVEKGTATPQEDFDAAMRAAEEEAGVPSDAEVYSEYITPPEAEVEPTEPETEPEPEAESAAVAETPVEEPVLLAGKYKTVEDLEKAYKEAERRIGEQANEVGQLRQLQEDFTQLREQVTAQPQTPAYTLDQFAAMLDEDPARATMIAHSVGDQQGFTRAWQAWNEVAPGSPQIWWDNQNLRGELATLQQSLASQIAPAQQLAQRSELEQALTTVAGRHGDFAQVVGTLDEARAQEIVESGFPAAILQGLTGDQQDKERVFETLYRWVKAEQTGQLVQAATEAAATQTEEARAAKLEATVASATTTTPEPVEETEAERLARVWKEERPSIRDAWQNREPSRLGR